jgi:hypothetical protein
MHVHWRPRRVLGEAGDLPRKSLTALLQPAWRNGREHSDRCSSTGTNLPARLEIDVGLVVGHRRGPRGEMQEVIFGRVSMSPPVRHDCTHTLAIPPSLAGWALQSALIRRHSAGLRSIQGGHGLERGTRLGVVVVAETGTRLTVHHEQILVKQHRTRTWWALAHLQGVLFTLVSLQPRSFLPLAGPSLVCG